MDESTALRTAEDLLQKVKKRSGVESLADVVKSATERDNGVMEPLTRPELDAKLKTVELTLDRRIDGIEAKLDGLKEDVSSTRNTVLWMTALIVGTVVATAGLVVTSFDSGRDTATMASEARAETVAALSEIRSIVEELKAAQTDPPQPARQ